MKDLSIIIVNWNTKELLDKCLSTIYKHVHDLNYEVIVSDNGSTDGSIEMVKENYPQAVLVENGKNIGFGSANNTAVKHSSGKNILFLNSDTEIFDNSIKKLYDFLNSNDKIGACGGKLLYPDRTLQHSYGYFPTFKRIVWITISGLLHINFKRKPLGVIPYDIYNPIQVDYIVGADLMVKRSVLDKSGVFDENFFAYFEETDLCYRIKEAGFQVWYVPECQIIHIYGGTFKRFSEEKFKIFTESQFKYYKKNLGHYKHLKYYFMLDNFIKYNIFRFINKSKYVQYKKMYNIIKKVSL